MAKKKTTKATKAPKREPIKAEFIEAVAQVDDAESNPVAEYLEPVVFEPVPEPEPEPEPTLYRNTRNGRIEIFTVFLAPGEARELSDEELANDRVSHAIETGVLKRV